MFMRRFFRCYRRWLLTLIGACAVIIIALACATSVHESGSPPLIMTSMASSNSYYGVKSREGAGNLPVSDDYTLRRRMGNVIRRVIGKRASPPVAAAIFFVSPTGSDSNPGSQALPFRTIQRAANIVNPGDTVIVENGVYTFSGSSPCFSKTIVCISRGGAPGQLVTFRSRNKWGAKLYGQFGVAANGFVFAPGANYVRIQNFEIGAFGNVSGSASGIEMYNGGSFSEILGNRIHNMGRVCTGTGNGQNGIFIQRNNILVDGNFIHDIGRFKPGQNGCNPPNQNWQNHDHGIYHSTGDDVTIRNNVLYNIQQGWPIHLYPNSRKRLNILNNTMAFNNLNPGKLGAIVIWGNMALSDSNIINNIFYQVNTAAIWVGGGTPSISNLRISNNIVSNGIIVKLEPGVSAAGMIVSNNGQHVDPGLVNPGGSDFHLRANSIAIDTGAVVPVPTDNEGRPRPQRSAFDVGAYEFP